MLYQFGSGVLFGRSLSSNNPTPVRFGGLQDVSIDMSFTLKELHGQYQFPIALGRGSGKISCKAAFAQINALTFNDLFFGLTSTATAQVKTATGEAKTVTANIVTATNNTSFTRDLGVTLASDGTLFTRVSSGPIGQQYSCNESTGVYTFNSSQNAVAVLINYQYTANTPTAGSLINISNQLMGNSPQFLAAFTNTFNGKSMTMVLNACVSQKLTLATKLEDFTIPQFEFSAFADGSNNIGSISLDE